MAIKRISKKTRPAPHTSFSCEFAGCVLEKYGQEDRIMSDVWAWVSYARVWDVAAGCPRAVVLTTDGFTHPDCRVVCEVDATPEIRAAYEAWLAAEATKKAAADKARREAEALRIAKTPAKGKTIKVVKGRKVPKGTVGVCIWIGAGDYGPRCGLKTAGGEVFWTALGNVEAVVEAA